MPIHFAASRRSPTSGLARCLSRPKGLSAQNDNGRAGAATLIDTPLLRAALEHLAAHGLAAAGNAFDRADVASRAGDAAGQHHWMAVCRMLDRRLPTRRSR